MWPRLKWIDVQGSTFGRVCVGSFSLSFWFRRRRKFFFFLLARNVYDTTSGSSSMAFRLSGFSELGYISRRERGKNEDG